MNLQSKNKFHWHELIDRKFVAVYVALALVLMINQVVFSVLLTDRDLAKAETIIFGNDIIGDTNYPELVDQLDAILPPGDDNPYVMAVDENNGFAYIGTSATAALPNKIIKIDLSTFTRVGEIDVDSLGLVMTALIDNTGTYGYFSFNSMPAKVIKVNLSDLTIVGSPVELKGYNNYTAVIDNTNNIAYYGTNLWLGEGGIEKIDLSTFTYADWMNPGQDSFRAAAIDETNGFVYFADVNMGGADTANVFKIDTDTFTLVTDPGTGLPIIITLVGMENISLNGIGLDGEYLWVSDTSYPAKLIKIHTTATATVFERVVGEDIVYEYEDVPPEIVRSGMYVSDVGGMKIDTANDMAYLSVDPATTLEKVLLKINLATGIVTPADVLTLDSFTGYNVTAFDIDFANNKAYLAGPGYPTQVEKVDLTSFTRELPVLDLAITIDRSQASVIDTENNFLYVASNYVPPVIAKIDLATFQLVEVIPLDNTLYNGMASGGIDIDDGYAYFNVTLKSLPGMPSGLLKIDIDPSRNFELAEVLNLSPVYPGVTLIDPVNNYAYIGTNTFPASVVRVDLDNAPVPASMVVLDQVDLSATFSDYELSFNSGVIDVANQFAYFGNWHPDLGSGRIFKIDINPANPLAKVDMLDFSATPAIRLFTTAVIDDTHQFAYFFARDPFVGVKVIKINIDPADFSNVATLALADAGLAGDVVMAGIDTNLGYAFFTTNGSINKIDVDPARTFSLLNQVAITAKGTIITDQASGFFYLITNQSVPVGIIKYGYTLAGYVQAYKVTLTSTVPEVDYFRFYSNVDSVPVRFALYDASMNLIWESASIITPVADSWIDIPVAPGAITNLLPGDYYLAFQTDSPEPVAAQISGDEGIKFPSTYDDFPVSIAGGITTTTGYSYYAAFVSSSQVGGTVPDLIHPGDVTNLQIKADSTGKVTLSWTDPTDSDLKEIVISETLLNGITQTYIFAKGTQTAVLTNRIIGSEYEYQVRARDISGLESLGVTSEITIPATGEVSADPSVPSEEVSEIILPDGVYVGDRIKVADSTTVYFVDDDKRRHTFPNEPTYFSYFDSFAGIKTLPLSTMALIAVGQNVTVRPGTWLVKIQTDPKVYAVEPYGVLKYVSTVDIAEKLYGADWTTRIIDISPAFFPDYQPGDPITTLAHPTEAVIRYQNSADIYFIDQGKKRLIPPVVFTNNKFQTKFILGNFDQTLIYPDGDPLVNQKIEDIIAIR